MDRRDYYANHNSLTLGEFDQQKMMIEFEYENDDGDAVVEEISAKYEVCGTCDGKGTHVNPSIDSHGLTSEDFEDLDFREDYFSGMYDQSCNECKGVRVVPVARKEHKNYKLYKKLCNEIESERYEDARICAAECGYRYGY